MKPISVDEFFNLTYLSNVTFSPEGRSACLTVSRIDRKKDEYRSYLYLRRNGKLRKLTSFGRESRFLYLDEDTILFPSRRDQPEEGDPSSVWYRISLSMGEAWSFSDRRNRVMKICIPAGKKLWTRIGTPERKMPTTR